MERSDHAQVYPPKQIVASHGGGDDQPAWAGAIVRLQKNRGAEIQVTVVLAENDLAWRTSEHGKETDPVTSIDRACLTNFIRRLDAKRTH